MLAEDINKLLNMSVSYKGSTYILTGIIKRKNDKGFYYQAEITDKCERSICICRLEELEAVNET